MFTQSNLDAFEARLDGAIQDDPENGIFRCRRDIFTDEELFELEMKHIFEGNWIYMAHESQIPEPGDYFTADHGPHARSSSPATRTASCTRWSTPVRTAARSSAGSSAATRRPSPARSTAGPSRTPASC